MQVPAVTKPHITATGPPDGRASDSEAANAVHVFRMAKARPSIVHFENERSKDWP